MTRPTRPRVDGLTVLFIAALAVGAPAVVVLLYVINGGAW